MNNLVKSFGRFFIVLLGTLLFLGGLWGIMIFMDIKYGEEVARIFVVLYLLLFLLIILRKEFNRENLTKFITFIKKIPDTSLTILKWLGFIILGLLGIILLFLIGGWILSISATTIIIILLVLILFK